MPFGLTNAPAMLMDLMNRVFRPYLDQYAGVFIDNILVYSSSYLEYEQHLKVVLQTVRENQLYAKLDKCDFSSKKFFFKPYNIRRRNIVDPRKVEAMLKWERPTNMTEIQSFWVLLGIIGGLLRGSPP
jgi:hypothetical protein